MCRVVSCRFACSAWNRGGLLPICHPLSAGFARSRDIVWFRAAARRNEAAGWLRRTVGAVAARDLPSEPSEEEFRLGLRNGQILCGALNRVHPGAVPKACAHVVFVNLIRSRCAVCHCSVMVGCCDVARARAPQVVVNTAADSVLQPDGAALSAFQYFENVRNFLVAAQEIGLPCFEASDLEQVRVGASHPAPMRRCLQLQQSGHHPHRRLL